MSDSPVVILFDSLGQPIGVDGNPLKVEGDITASIDKTGLATDANQVAQTSVLNDIKTAVQAAPSAPAGSATSALQSAGNTSLSNIDTKLGNPLHVISDNPTDVSSLALETTASATKTAAEAIDTKLGGTLNVDGSAHVQPVSDGGGSLTVDSTQLPAALDGSGNFKTRALVSGTDSVTTVPSGTQTVSGSVSISGTTAVSAASLPLPTNASTSALQTAGNASLSSIDTKLPAQVGGKVPVDVGSPTVTVGNASLAVTAASLPLPSGASTSALQTSGNASLTSIDSKLTNPLPVSGTVSVAGVATAALQGTANTSLGSIDTKTPALVSGCVPVDGSGVIQPVSLASAPLATGASTSALQTTGNSSLASIDTKLTNPLPVSGTVTATVTGVATQTTLASIDAKTPTVTLSQTGSITAVAQTVQIGPMDGASFGTIQVTGTFVLTLIPETSDDNVNWTAQNVNPAANSFQSSFISSTGVWNFPVTGHYFRLRCSAYTSGQADSKLSTSTGASARPLGAVAQGNGGSPGGYWYVRSTDGTNSTPAMDAAARKGFQAITDGSNTAAVKAASTAAVAADPALVVSVSPNNTVAVSMAAAPTGSATSALQTTGNASLSSIDAKLTNPLPVSGTLSTATPAVSSGLAAIPATGMWVPLTLNGRSSASVQLTIPTAFSGTLAPRYTLDGTNYFPTYWYDLSPVSGSYGQWLSTEAFNFGATNYLRAIVLPAGTVGVAIQCTAYVSGSINAMVTATNALPQAPNLTPALAPHHRITDGSNTVTVKPGSGAAASTDTALVVAVSPNNTVGVIANATDTILTNGTAKTQITGINKGTTTAAGVTATPAGSNHTALDVAIVDASGNQITSFGGTSAATGTNNAAAPTSSTQMGGSDGTNLQAARVFDLDSSGGTQYILGVALRKPGLSGSVEAGTASDPIRTDPTGTTIQPVSGTITANLGTVGTTLALDATLIGGAAKSIVRGGTKGSTTAADVTSTASGANHQPMDVIIYDASGNPITSFGGGTQYADGAARGTATGSLMMVDDGTNVQSLAGDTAGNQLSRMADISGTVSVTGSAQTFVILPNVHGAQTLHVYTSGTYIASSLVEGTIDGTTWFVIPMYRPDNGYSSVTFFAVSGSLHYMPIGGWKQVRIRNNSFSSGTQVLTWTASQAPSPYQQQLLVSVIGGTIAQIGTTVPTSGHGALNVSIGQNSGWDGVTASLTSAISANVLNLKGGKAGYTSHFTASTLVGTVVPEFTLDGSNWVACKWIDQSGIVSSSVLNPAAGTVLTHLLPPGAISARIRCSAFTSGSASVLASVSSPAQPVITPSVITDGVNQMPTMDTVARSGYHRITDGTNYAAVRASGQAPTSVEAALVVVQSPNLPTLIPGGIVNVNVTATSSQALPLFTSRKTFCVTNTGANPVYFFIGSTSAVAGATGTWTVKIPAGGYYEPPMVPGFRQHTGTMQCICDAGQTSTLVIQEYS